MNIQFSYTPKQTEIFFDEERPRFCTVGKGRRLGFTHGLFIYLADTSIDSGPRKILWGDTVSTNIDRYIQRYLVPELKKMPPQMWDWMKTAKMVRINETTIDFRGADNPENWEGFGYDGVILNEAGIILKNRYLWSNAVRPMLLDNPKSWAIIGGVPKGINQFAELIEYGKDEKNVNWKHYQASTYDNPFLKRDDIDELIEELGGSDAIIRQEIFGEVVDNAGSDYFTYTELKEAVRRQPIGDISPCVWGIDVARHGDDKTKLAIRNGKIIDRLITINAAETSEHEKMKAMSDEIKSIYDRAAQQPKWINIDVTGGLGWGLYEFLYGLKLPVVPVDFSKKSLVNGVYNKRAECYDRFKKTLHLLTIPDDKEMIFEFVNTDIEFRGNDLKIVDKKIIKKAIGRSPDSAEAVILCFSDEYGTIRKEEIRKSRRRADEGRATWNV